MLMFGKVIEINHKEKYGIVRDQLGNTYFFSACECENEQLPPLHTRISFYKDDDFKSTKVACYVRVNSTTARAA